MTLFIFVCCCCCYFAEFSRVQRLAEAPDDCFQFVYTHARYTYTKFTNTNNNHIFKKAKKIVLFRFIVFFSSFVYSFEWVNGEKCRLSCAFYSAKKQFCFCFFLKLFSLTHNFIFTFLFFSTYRLHCFFEKKIIFFSICF